MKQIDQIVKITAKPDTWFKAGTEVLIAYGKEPYKRITFQQLYDYMAEEGCIIGAVFFGTRIVSEEYELHTNRKIGDERLDEEMCAWDEFIYEFEE